MTLLHWGLFLGSSLITKIMSQNYHKIQPPENGNTYYSCQNSRTRCHLQGETLEEVSFSFIHHLWTFPADLWCELDTFQVLESISEHKNRVTKTVNLYSYLTFCGNIMCTTGPNDNLCLPKATGMDTNGCDMPNDSNFSLFWAMEDVLGPHGDKMKNWICFSYSIFWDKNHRFRLPAKRWGVR